MDGSHQPGPMTDDIVEQGGRRFPSLRWRPSRGAAILAALALLTGLAAGYAAGERQAGSSARPPQRPETPAAPTASPAAGAPALTQANGGCSAQIGRDLQLGEQVTNQSATEVTLRQVEAVLPLGGLRAISQQWAPCGALPTGHDLAGNRLPPGASIWFTVTFKVLRGCPRPLPVQFTIDYDWHGRAAVARLPGFPDLSEVPYTGCPGN